MPRKRRRMGKPPGRARRRVRADWVYRPDVFDEVGGIVDDNGTYSRGDRVLVPGDANANAAVLYDSYNRVQRISIATGNVPQVMPAWARSEGQRPLIMAVQGTIVIRPSVWAVGSLYHLGIRFGVFEQDVNTSAFLIDPLYAMWTQPTNMAVAPARWANDGKWQREFRRQEHFASNEARWQYNFAFRVNRRLDPHECYGMYIASDGISVNLVYNLWFRTLVSDEG